jgi:hypothetical protein
VRNRVLVYAEAVDVAAEGAVWYARKIAGSSFKALHVPGKNTDTGINARWFDLTGGEPRLEMLPEGTDATKAVLAEIAKLRERDDDVVTVVLPEQFQKRSLMAAAQRAQFRLKLRLLVEPGVVVADVPTVTSERRPEGRVPEQLRVRVLAGGPEDATHRAVEYARELGLPDARAVHFGERDWDDAELGLPVDDEPQPARLGDNVVLPEQLRDSLPRLRSRQALAVKRCLLFEPHVILSSVPTRA